jgi:hypothetical protein
MIVLITTAIACKLILSSIENDETDVVGRPILTYTRRACTKTGAKPQYHGQVFTGSRVPALLGHEPPLGYKAIRMVPHNQTERLDPESRVNYSALTRIEHNARIQIVGSVHGDYLNDFLDSVENYSENRGKPQRHHKKGA